MRSPSSPCQGLSRHSKEKTLMPPASRQSPTQTPSLPTLLLKERAAPQDIALARGLRVSSPSHHQAGEVPRLDHLSLPRHSQEAPTSLDSGRSSSSDHRQSSLSTRTDSPRREVLPAYDTNTSSWNMGLSKQSF